MSDQNLPNCSTLVYRKEDNYIHASALCAPRRFRDWKRLTVARNYIKTTLKELNSLGNNYEERDIISYQHDCKSAWVHPLIAISLAQWVSTEVAVRVSSWVLNWKNCSAENERTFDATFSTIIPDDKPEYKEHLIQRKWSDCELEVETPVGFIDVLTDTEIIEIKRANNWKHAVGQVICYGNFYPNLQKRIHLFGIDVDDPMLMNIREVCQKNNIHVTIETDIAYASDTGVLTTVIPLSAATAIRDERNDVEETINVVDLATDPHCELLLKKAEELMGKCSELEAEWQRLNQGNEKGIACAIDTDVSTSMCDLSAEIVPPTNETPPSKACTVCKETKILEEYYKRTENLDGFESKCKACINRIKLDQRKKNREALLQGASKKCKKCKAVKPINLFRAHPTSADGYANACLACTQPEAPVDTPNKTCSLCHESKARAEFNNCKTSVDGLFNYCKACTKLKNAQYKAKTRPKRPTEPLTEQVCKRCKKTKPIASFKPHSQSLTGFSRICVECK